MNLTSVPPFPASAREGLSVGLIAYNEAPSLEATARELLETLRAMGLAYELCIVDDGSRDGTPELADRLVASEPGVSVIHHSINQGIGPTFRDALTSGTLPFVTVFAGDGQFPASILNQFLPLVQEADLVLGYVPDLDKGRPRLLVFCSWVERLIVRSLFGAFPKFQGVMMIRRSLLDRLHLTSEGRGWIIQMELVIRALQTGARIVTAPTPLRPREHGASRATTLRNILSNFKQIISLWFRLKAEKPH